ncbi:hypothetical protein K458DRAFT_418087 [Lentithecium fluviatile CBS 122367]|uniref:Uncharacterized protein n=1 Tax=Lentithecium fluviatile CBS 122367 TaxID=1168545 RepID=A0A6G1J2S1_9PLEO|nr:hypothetical protein K458DRAFT_418087 [Lentithecium fluviatile CBS 122367]
MPRPKRAKVASKVARVATKTIPADPARYKQHHAKAQTISPSQPLDSFSDDSDGLVVKATRPRRRMPWQPEPQEGVDFTMTGALPRDNEEDIPAPSTKNRAPATKTPKKTRTSKGSAQASSTRKSPIVSMPRSSRSMQSNVLGEPAQEEDSSGFGDHLLSFTSLDSNSPAHGTRPPSAIKVGATPAHETSILALTNFKRRPRQPSLLRMVHQTTDVEDNDLDDLGDFDDFRPAAESTPLHVQKSAPEEGGNDSGVNLSSSGSRGTKRKLSPVIQVPRSSPPYNSGPDIEDSRSPSPSLPEVVQSTEEAQQTQEQAESEILSQTMAPPMSSSDYPADDIEDPLESPVRPRQRTRRGKSTKAGDNEDSEGEETEPAKKTKARPKSRKNPEISTAKLQSLLPRRRTRVAQEGDEFDMDNSEDVTFDSDQDELALPPRRQPAAGRKPAPKPKKPSKTTRKAAASSRATQKNTRTYGRPGSSDKENAGAREDSDGEGSTIEVTTVQPSKALEAIAKKFEEVDEFELDFESVSYVQTSSSPMR